MDLLNELQIEDLSEDQAQLAAVVGMIAYKKLIENYAGTAVYVPTQSALIAPVRDKLIKSEYLSGASYRELAVKWGLTSVWVRKIIQGDATSAAAPFAGQIGLADLSE